MIILLFFAVITIPLASFNTTPNAISHIDNRNLTKNPFQIEGDLTINIQNYINDRIGFRNEMITAYTILNDRLFGKMVHPSYSYGKDGYVFGNGIVGNSFNNYHLAFVEMVADIQTYCEERNVPFLFVFNPAKPAVYQDKLANGINYNRSWVDTFLSELAMRKVNYLDNTETMLELRENNIDGFNQKYDANHWNDLGAYYGTKRILERLKVLCPNIYINELEDFELSEELMTSLLATKFPINEDVPQFKLKIKEESLYNEFFPELKIDPAYQSFGYYINESEKVKNTPRTLFFQGSYMNSYGYKFMINALREYIFVHDYQNVIDFSYYFNIFQPDCVVFEVAEYTFQNKYFDYGEMIKIDYHPALSTMPQNTITSVNISDQNIAIDKGNTLTTITWYTNEKHQYVWMSLDGVYDMRPIDGGYQVTISSDKNFEYDEMLIYFTIS